MTRKIRVGATVPSPLGDSQIMMELEFDIKDDEDIYQTTNDAKMLLAELISGKEPTEFNKILLRLNYPNLETKATDNRSNIEKIQSDIEILKIKTAKTNEVITRLIAVLNKCQTIERLKEFSDRHPEYKKALELSSKEVSPTVDKNNTGNVEEEGNCDQDNWATETGD